MFCENCGKEIPEGNLFCDQCGWKVPEEEVVKSEEPVTEEVKAEETNTEEVKTEETSTEEVKAEGVNTEEPKPAEAPVAEPVRPVEPVYSPVTPPTSGKKAIDKKLATIIGAVAAALLLIIIIVANGAAISNSMKRTFSSPEKYYQWVEKKNAKELASSAASIYSSYLLESMKVYDTGASAEVTLELDEAGQDMLSLAGLAGVDLSWFKSGTIYYEGYSKDNIVQNMLGFGLGKEKLLSVDTIIDMEEENLYLAIPELSKSYIGVETGDMSGYVASADSTDMMAVLKSVCEKLPQEKQVQKLLAKYFEVALGSVEDVDMKKGKTLRAEGITQKCTELEVTIDAGTVEDVLKAVLEEMEEDKEIQKIIEKLCDELAKQDLDGVDDIDSDEVYEAFQDACKEARKNTKYLVDSDMELVMTLYVDSKGNVRGREIEYNDGWDTFKLEISNPHKGSKFGFKAAVSADGEEISVTGTGKDSGGKISGEFTVKYNGAGIVDFTAKNFDTNKLKKGYLNGKFTAKAASGVGRALNMTSVASALSDIELSIDVSMSSNSQKLVVSLAEDDEKWGSVSVAAERKSGKKASVPKNAIFVEDEDDFEDYWDTIDWDKFLKKLDKADIPSDIIDVVEDIADLDSDEVIEGLGSLLYGSMGRNLRYLMY